MDLAELKASLALFALSRVVPCSDEDLLNAATEILKETKPGGRNDPRKIGSDLPMCFLLLRSTRRAADLVQTIVKAWIQHLDEQCGNGFGVHAAVMMVSCWVCAHVLESHGFCDDSTFLEGVAGAEEVEKGDTFALACLVRASTIVRFASLPVRDDARHLAN